jgi:transcriptional regulator with XRE-family HTH domain
MRPKNPYEVRDSEKLRRAVESSTRVISHSTRSLAEVTGFSHATISELMTGRKQRVTAELAHSLSAALGVPMKDLFVARVSVSADKDKRSAEATKGSVQDACAVQGADTPEEAR